MTIQEEAKRVKMGQALTDLESQLLNAKAQVSAIETNIKNLRAEMEKDALYTTEDVKVIDDKILELKI